MFLLRRKNAEGSGIPSIILLTIPVLHNKMVIHVIIANIDSLFIDDRGGIQKMMYVFKEGEITTAYIRLMTWFKNIVAFVFRHRNQFTMDNLENLLKKICEYIEKYQKSFVFFGVIIFLVFILIACFMTTFIEFSTIIGAILAFIISFLGMMRVFRQFKIQVDQVKDQAKKASMEMAAEQFKNAIDHLGNEKQSVVLGGVHALHNLAMNFPKDYSQQVFEVLCSFIREETRKPEYQAKVTAQIESSDETQKKESSPPSHENAHLVIDTTQIPLTKSVTSLIVIQTIVDKLFREKIELDEMDERTGRKLLLYRKNVVNLNGAFLRGLDFSRVTWEHEEINLRNANVQGTIFWDADLQGADLIDANLQGAELIHANLQGAKLYRAKLQGADLKQAKLQGADLIYAKLQGVDLWETNLQGAVLLEANLQGADLHGAKLQGADLRYAKLDEENRRLLIERGIITEEDFPPPPPQQADDETTADET